MADKNLVVELSKKIEIARDEHKYQMRKPKKDIKINRWHNMIEFSPKLKLVFKELCVLNTFMRQNPELTNEEISNLLKTKFFKFKTLRKCEQKIPDFFNELREMGAEYCTIFLAQRNELRVSRI